MEYKIIRISAEIHSEYKNFIKKNPDYNLSSATEEIIKLALKRGEIKDSGKTAYKAVKELENIFKSWLRQQEKIHLSKISEELLALAQELRNTATKDDITTQGEKEFAVLEKVMSNLSTILANEWKKSRTEIKVLETLIENQTKAIDEIGKRLATQTQIINEKLNKKMFS